MACLHHLESDCIGPAETLRGFHWLAIPVLHLPKVIDGLCLASWQFLGYSQDPVGSLPYGSAVNWSSHANGS